MRSRLLARLPRASDLLPEAGSLFFACPKKSNQKKEHPHLALSGLAAQPVREGRPGFSTGLLPRRKGIGVLPIPPAGPARPPLTAALGGPKVKSVEPTARAAARHIASWLCAARRPWCRYGLPLRGEFSTEVGKRSDRLVQPQR